VSFAIFGEVGNEVHGSWLKFQLLCCLCADWSLGGQRLLLLLKHCKFDRQRRITSAAYFLDT
jgi:hypothetical protein